MNSEMGYEAGAKNSHPSKEARAEKELNGWYRADERNKK